MKDGTKDRLKMSLLYFLATVIKGKAKVIKGPIDKFILRVVDDLALCKTFPWGRYTFDACVKEVLIVMDKCKGSVRNSVTLPGFILPLEVKIIFYLFKYNC